VTSRSGAQRQPARIASIRRATVSPVIRLGVPPPKKTLVSSRPGVRAATWAISAASATAQARWSIRATTWLLKSQ